MTDSGHGQKNTRQFSVSVCIYLPLFSLFFFSSYVTREVFVWKHSNLLQVPIKVRHKLSTKDNTTSDYTYGSYKTFFCLCARVFLSEVYSSKNYKQAEVNYKRLGTTYLILSSDQCISQNNATTYFKPPTTSAKMCIALSTDLQGLVCLRVC